MKLAVAEKSSQLSDHLIEWRKLRRWTVEELAQLSGISEDELLQIESGEVVPSRDALLALTEDLLMTKASTNEAMSRAGYEPAFPNLPQDHPSLAPVREAINALLVNHMPNPALVIDKHWNILHANKCALRFEQLAKMPTTYNTIELLIEDDPETSPLENWAELATLMLARLKTEILHQGREPVLEKMRARLAGHPRLDEADLSNVDLYAPFVPIKIKIEGQSLSLFSTVTHFGTVQDVALDGVRVELMFPADEITKQWLIDNCSEE